MQRSAQAAVDPQTKPPDLGSWAVACESACRQLSSTTTIAIYYYYSARKLILIYHPMHVGEKAELT